MRVMVTGGTGFVGFHTAQALLAAGHEVSLLVRSVDKMLQLYGEGCIEYYTRGDITDAEKVREALSGCDALVHSAAMVSTDAADAQRVFDTNFGGTQIVLRAGLEAEVASMIHVSSVTALFNPAAQVLDEKSPVGSASSGYGRSKVASEEFVRELQAAGAPVHITYPASVIGPDDPGLTEPHEGLKTFLTQFIPVMDSGNQYVDVRDVAAAHLKLFTGEAPFGRYLLGGHYLPWREHGPLLEDITGRRLRQIPINSALMRFLGRTLDALAPWVSFDVPITEEAMGYATGWVPMDNSLAESALDLEFRPLRESMTDAINWLYQSGHISGEQAGEVL